MVLATNLPQTGPCGNGPRTPFTAQRRRGNSAAGRPRLRRV